ncbi:MAG: hypothetical protein AAGH41_06360 [Pseudomonadota bacterium]
MGQPVEELSGTPGKGQPVVFTICARNYLPQASLLVASVAQHHPGLKVLVFVLDAQGDEAEIQTFLGVPVVSGADLGLPTFFDMAIRYDILEFSTAIKPACFQYVFGTGAPWAIYLDPDMEVLQPLREVEARLARGAQAVITPHITQPLDMQHDPTELKLIRTGIYNLGFAAIANTEEAHRFVQWWADRMPTDCRVDLDAGIFVDQKYVDLMPSYLPRTDILRHRGYNVAYWNLAHRPLHRSADGPWMIDDDPAVLMHYSGIRADDADIVSVHQNRLTVSDLGEGRALFADYRERLKAQQTALNRSGIATQYAFGTFTSGETITRLMRDVYARTVPPTRAAYADVFSLEKASCVHGATGLTHRAAHLISPIMFDLWNRKAHLQAAFDLKSPASAERFAVWFAETGHREFGIAKAFVPHAVWEVRQERKSLKARWALTTLRMIEWGKKTAFLYPKPFRRAAARTVRRALPHIARRIR